MCEGLPLTPPLARVLHGQVDGLNDCLVLEVRLACWTWRSPAGQDLESQGYQRPSPRLSRSARLQHCRAMLVATAKVGPPLLLHLAPSPAPPGPQVHALSLHLGQARALTECWPFAVEGEAFSHRWVEGQGGGVAAFWPRWRAMVAPVQESLLDYLRYVVFLSTIISRWEVSLQGGMTFSEVEAKLESLVSCSLIPLLLTSSPCS